MTEELQAECVRLLDTSITQARRAIESKDNAQHLVALPSDFKLQDLEKYQPHRRRAHGEMATIYPAPFAQYVKLHAALGATVFIDPDVMRAKAVLNLGEPEHPGHADDTATYFPARLAPYVALRAAVGEHLTQKRATEFIEDWRDWIECQDAQGNPLKNKAVIAALRAIKVDTQGQIESTAQTLSASRSTFESVSIASARTTLPHVIVFTCQPYAIFQHRTFILRVSSGRVHASGEAAPDAVSSILLRPASPVAVASMSCRCRSAVPAAGLPKECLCAARTGCRPGPPGHPPLGAGRLSVRA